VRCPLSAGSTFLRKIFCDINFRQRVQSLVRAIHMLAVDGLWRNVEVGKAFVTACLSVNKLHRTCDRGGPKGNALTICSRK
jgi:hypothetical protein